MPGISQKRFHSSIRGPAAEALDALAPHSREVLTRWSNSIRHLKLDPSDFLQAPHQNFSWLAEQLRKSTLTSFRANVQQLGQRLVERGAAIDAIITALNRLFEACLPALRRATSKRALPILALARLHALISLLVVAGHNGTSIDRKQTLVEASLTEAEHRLHGISAYVTRIYERERRRLSHDLHDEIGHDLILLKLYLEMISTALKKEGPAVIGARLNDAIGLVSHAIDSVRRLILDLGPAVFDELGFMPAIKSYAAQFSSRTRIDVTVQEGYLPENVPLTHQIALYRLLQGALSNVLKHSQARNVRISIGSMKDSVLIMVVEDDGVGFDTGARPNRRSVGLTAMRERVEVLGGRIYVESRRASA